MPCSPSSPAERRGPRPRGVALPLALLLACGATTGSIEGVQWRLAQLGERVVAAGEDPRRAPSLRLEAGPEGARALGSGGCNRFTGGYTLEGDTLRFTPLAATKMACPDLETEAAYFAALAATRGWRLAGDRLELLDEAGAPVARFERAPAGEAP